jgi:hypothetical protein
MWASVRLSALPGNLLALYLLSIEPASGGQERQRPSNATASSASDGSSVASSLVIGWKDPESVLFSGLTCCILIGCALLLCCLHLPATLTSEEPCSPSPVPVQQDTPALLTVLRLHFRLTPLMLFSGLNVGFLFSSLPGLMPLMLVPKVSMVIAVVEFAMCFVYGHIADVCGSFPVFTMALCLQFAAVTLLCFLALSADVSKGPYAEIWWYAATVLVSAADAGWQSQTYTAIGSTGTGGHRTQAFAVFGVVQHVGYALAWAHFFFELLRRSRG